MTAPVSENRTTILDLAVGPELFVEKASNETLFDLRQMLLNGSLRAVSHARTVQVIGELLSLRSDYDSLLRKFAEVERDAARYRWLRDVSNEEVDVTVPRLVEDQYPLKYCSYSGDELDMAIDASMRKP